MHVGPTPGSHRHWDPANSRRTPPECQTSAAGNIDLQSVVHMLQLHRNSGPLKKNGERLTPQLTCKEFGTFHPRILLLESSPPESIELAITLCEVNSIPHVLHFCCEKITEVVMGKCCPQNKNSKWTRGPAGRRHSTDFWSLRGLKRICVFHLAVWKPMISYGRRVGPSWSTWLFSSRASLGESYYDFTHLNYTIWFFGGGKKLKSFIHKVLKF